VLKRNVVVIDRSGEVFAAIERRLSMAYQVVRAAGVAEAKRAMAARYCHVCVMVLEPTEAGLPPDLESDIGHEHAEWIAVVPDLLLELEPYRKLIGTYFCDYHRLPIDSERLVLSIGHAAGMAELRRGPHPPQDPAGRFGLVGRSAPMLELFRRIGKVVNVDEPVLLGGESGTGKELVAQAIYRHSARTNGPFVALDCGAISSSLIQSELFGHEKGAFTGALRRKIGKIEAADGGVLFLDEIGDLPLDLQTNLLRFLQERTIVRVGGREPVRVDVRVIAATHVDLEQAVAEGRFRQDLYYRLNVLQLRLPPLRVRNGDIELLAKVFLDDQMAAQKVRPRAKGFSVGALRAMAAHAWPGNVRELSNVVKRAVILSENRLLTAADLGLSRPVAAKDDPRPSLEQEKERVQRDVLESTLRKSHFNVSQAARELGVSRVTVYRMITKLKIDVARVAADVT
jgi:DNA-binding NtrC family response regulator